jgi:hypothetical protein
MNIFCYQQRLPDCLTIAVAAQSPGTKKGHLFKIMGGL